MIKVVFVCTGNICRSPTAEAVFRAHVQKAGLEEYFEISSRATHSYHIGEGADPRTVAMAHRFGYDLSAHWVKQLTVADVKQAHYLILMDKVNLADYQTRFGSLSKKAELFMRFGLHPEQTVVPDPYYGGEADFRDVVRLCEEASEGFLKYLKNAHGLVAANHLRKP